MLKIGIIGTENSHAMAFSKIINLPDPVTGTLAYPDARVVGVYGPDLDSAHMVAEKAKVDFIADSPSDFFGKIDAMIITCRRGSVHSQYARPFIKAGMPVFLDKPITADYAQAQELIALAKEKNSLLCGGVGMQAGLRCTYPEGPCGQLQGSRKIYLRRDQFPGLPGQRIRWLLFLRLSSDRDGAHHIRL